MKNCVNCGAALDDWAASCHICGSAQPMVSNQQGYGQPQMNYGQQPQMGYDQSQMGYGHPQMGYNQPQAGYSQPYGQVAHAPKSANKKVIIIVLIIALLVVAGVILAVVFAGKGGSKKDSDKFKNGSKQEVLETYYNAMVDEDAEMVVACMYTDDLLDALLDSEDMSRDELYDEVESMYFESLYADWDEVKNIEITDEEELDDSEVEYFNEVFADEYDYDCNIKEMYVCDIDYEYYDSYYESWEEDTDTLLLFKMDGGWYVSQW